MANLVRPHFQRRAFHSSRKILSHEHGDVIVKSGTEKINTAQATKVTFSSRG